MNGPQDIKKLFKADGTPLEEDNCYQKILSRYMDMIGQIEDNYRVMGRHYHETNIIVREDTPELDPAQSEGGRLARDFFDREVDGAAGPVARRDVAHDVEVLIEATRRHVRRGEYPAVKANLERVDRDLRELVRKLKTAHEAILAAKRLEEDHAVWYIARHGEAWTGRYDEMEAKFYRWLEALDPGMPRSIYHLQWYHEPEGFVESLGWPRAFWPNAGHLVMDDDRSDEVN
ncbi:hypothetical protein SLS55_002007 [Diplodia seriata]|uniref:Uncharacterized protein n=1 Tax=Diplodia seriata TaxID=420778 RepID=A0ABR3CQY1_9PEZI